MGGGFRPATSASGSRWRFGGQGFGQQRGFGGQQRFGQQGGFGGQGEAIVNRPREQVAEGVRDGSPTRSASGFPTW